MPTVNEVLIEEAVSHMVDLNQYSNGVVRRMSALLARLEPELFDELAAALERLPAGSFTVERLERLIVDVKRLNTEAVTAYADAIDGEMRRLADLEAAYQFNVFKTVLPSELMSQIALVSPEAAYAAAMARPFQGRLLRGWASRIGETRMVRIREAIRQGYIKGDPTPSIIRMLRGTKAGGYQDGLLQIDRNSAEAVVRTAVSHTAASVRERFYSENDALVSHKVWVSTLDARTSLQWCVPRDGKEYTKSGSPIGHKLPWLNGPGRIHWCCRSSSAPVIKSAERLGLSPGTRASMDGQVPSTVTYEDWLMRQSDERQIEVLGWTRYELMKTGTNVGDFWNDKGLFLTLDQLRSRNGAAFARLGATA